VLQKGVIVKMQINIGLPVDCENKVDFSQLERVLGRTLSNNPEKDFCICETSDEKIMNNIKNYFLSSYTFGVGISPSKKEANQIKYKIKFSANI